MDVSDGCPAEQLCPLAELPYSLGAPAGQVLTRQGEQAVSFLPIQSGRAEVRHIGSDGAVIVDELSAEPTWGRSRCCHALTVAAPVGGFERFTARVLADNQPMRAILDRFGAHWERDDPAVVNTGFEVPGTDALRIEPSVEKQVQDVALQVIRAVG